jgi:hypothetical protein
MTIESAGAAVFGFIIGYVAWRVINAPGERFRVTHLASLVGVLAGAAILRTFPAGTALFAWYSIGLGAGFFFSPVVRSLGSKAQLFFEGMDLVVRADYGEFSKQLEYLDTDWAEVQGVISAALARTFGPVNQKDLLALPLSESGRRAALKKYARLNPDSIRTDETIREGLRLHVVSAAIKHTPRSPGA